MKTGGINMMCGGCERTFCANDPSAGSPTETLLRLLLPLDDKVCEIFHCQLRELKSQQSK